MSERLLSRCTQWIVRDFLQKYPVCVVRKPVGSSWKHNTIKLNYIRLCSSSVNAHVQCVQQKPLTPFSLSPNSYPGSGQKCLYFSVRGTALSSWRSEGFTRKGVQSINGSYHARHYSHESGSATSQTNEVVHSGLYHALCETTPVVFTQELLLKLHELSGLHWWSTIVMTTILLRTCITLPLSLYQNYILAKLENLKLEMNDLVKELKKETNFAVYKFQWPEKHARRVYNLSLKKQWTKLVIRDNCHPAKASLLALVQIPMWVSLSLALRNLVFMLPKSDAAAELTVLELAGGGTLWFHNLISADATFLLPIILGLTNLAIIEMQNLSRIQTPTRFRKVLTNILRGVSILMVPVAASVPSALSLYWVTSSLVGLVHNLVVLSPQVRRFCGIPPSPSVPDEPYTYMRAKFMARFE